MKTHWSGGIAPRILNLGTRWRWVVSLTPRPLYTPGERAPGTHWIGDLVSPRAGLDAVTKRKIPSLPPPGIEPRSSSPCRVSIWQCYLGSFGYRNLVYVEIQNGSTNMSVGLRISRFNTEFSQKLKLRIIFQRKCNVWSCVVHAHHPTPSSWLHNLAHWRFIVT
jgi:hypothetical protein